MPNTDLGALIGMQLDLQTQHMGGDPRDLFAADPEGWADFMRWNAYALTDELHEATAETGWKPWATSRHLNQEAFMKEMVDAFHFFMNMLLAANPGADPDDIAQAFCEAYFAKNAVNAQRQIDGYDGLSTKCPHCHRELSETDSTKHKTDEHGVKFCSSLCRAKGTDDNS